MGTQGRDVFHSVARIGLKHTNQIAIAFQGAEEEMLQMSGEMLLMSGVLQSEIDKLVISGASPQVVGSGDTPPDGVVEGQIGFFEDSKNEFFEYAWLNSQWTRISTQTNDVTPAFTSPFVLRNISYENQSDINQIFGSGIVNNENAIAAIIASGGGGGETYHLETDASSSPQIQLVDSTGAFSNVKLTGQNGITISTISANELGIRQGNLPTNASFTNLFVTNDSTLNNQILLGNASNNILDVKKKLLVYALKTDDSRPSWEAFTIQSEPGNDNFSLFQFGKRVRYPGTYVNLDGSVRTYVNDETWDFRDASGTETVLLSITKDGCSIKKALNMNSFKITNLANPTNSNDAVNKQYLDTALNSLGGSVGGDSTVSNLPFETKKEWQFNIYSTGGSSTYNVNKIYYTYIDTDTIKLNISQDALAGISWNYATGAHELVEFPISIIGKDANGKRVLVLSGKTSSIRSLAYEGTRYWQVYVPAANTFKFDPNSVDNNSKVECKIHGYM